MARRESTTLPHTCLACHRSFVPKWGGPGKYCSRKCRDIGQVKRETRTCPTCGIAFERRPSHKTRYCSLACSQPVTQAKQVFRELRTCPQCGQSFETIPSRKQVYCSRACIDTYHREQARKPIPKICAQCGEEFGCNPWTPDVVHCSQKCAMRDRARTVRGISHPLHKPKVALACAVCGVVVLVKPSEVDRFRACSRRCAGQLGLRSRPRSSSLERRMLAAFQDAGLSPVPQFPLSYYTVDFAFPSERLIVECDGTYWHSFPKQQRLDRSKDGYCKSHGWRILRLPETAINADIVRCVTLVQEALCHTPTPPPREEPAPGPKCNLGEQV